MSISYYMAAGNEVFIYRSRLMNIWYILCYTNLKEYIYHSYILVIPFNTHNYNVKLYIIHLSPYMQYIKYPKYVLCTS